MNSDFSLLKNCILFSGISNEDLQKMFVCISAYEKVFAQDSFVFNAGDDIKFVYLIVSGSMHIIDEDYWGNRSIIETMEKDTLFGEAYVFSAKKHQLVSVIAAEDSVVLEIDPVTGIRSSLIAKTLKPLYATAKPSTPNLPNWSVMWK